MCVPIETFSGSHYEMGVQHGRAFRHAVHAVVANTLRHDFEECDADLDAALTEVRAADMEFAPWLADELHGIADGSGVEYGRIERMHLRVWNFVPRAVSAPPACTSIGMRTEDAGVIVGGNLDDPRMNYALVRRRPRSGLAHVMINWVGAAWGHNGMNEAGLAVAQSSLGGYAPAPPRDPGKYLRGSMGTRLLLENCRDVPAALELLRKMRPESSYVLGDAAGNLVACQCLGGSALVVQPADEHAGVVFSTNHIHMPALTARMAEWGCHPEIAEHSGARFAALQGLLGKMPRTVPSFMALLRSHAGWPHSVCRNATAFSTFAPTQATPAALHVADRPPCKNEYFAYRVDAED